MIGSALGFLGISVFVGLPVALAILFCTSIYFFTSDTMPPVLVFQAFVSGMESFPLLAIPFFILVGEIMNASGMTSRILVFSENFVGHLTGGLAQVNVLSNAFIGGLSGSANADAAAISKTLVPEMEKRGYDRAWSSALTAAGSIMGPILPPGIALVLFGYLANVSIGKLFIGGIIPGILICIALMVTVHIVAKRRGYKPTREKMANPRELWSSFLDASWALIIPVVIIGGIRIGMFTETEAAAMAVVGTWAVGCFVYKSFKLKDVIPVLAETVRITAIIMLILAASNGLGRMLTFERIPHMAAEFLTSLSDNPYVILFIINIALLVIGCLADGSAILIVMTPILMPTILALGIDPIAFGIVMVLNITIGGIHPPFGAMMFTVCSLNKVSVGQYTREIWPFLAAVIAVLLLITYVPWIVTVLPNLLM
ncbi:TRAP transporter large permease [Paenibacillus hamazuiensis]|uniref:TRAP transporter large permease n=1 Tax=Paenibacillus hamazuiensis TaxID=2936508 RepID=UPI00200FF093|nr:TRAP transporter large permease [Paenibacillus hamazuiensis]